MKNNRTYRQNRGPTLHLYWVTRKKILAQYYFFKFLSVLKLEQRGEMTHIKGLCPDWNYECCDYMFNIFKPLTTRTPHLWSMFWDLLFGVVVMDCITLKIYCIGEKIIGNTLRFPQTAPSRNTSNQQICLYLMNMM